MDSLQPPIEVDVGRIERELRTLWAASTPMGRGSGGNVVRACALNLVTVLWNEDDAESVQGVLAKVSHEHPARVIVVTTAPEAAEDSARGWISLRCEKPGAGGLRVCHEEIMLALSGKAACHIDNILLSILVPDLPTFLWWNGRLPETSLEERAFGTLAMHADRLVLDSLRLRNPYVELAAMTLFTHDEGHHATLGDLNYHRITGWRQILAQAFEPAEVRPLLARIRRLHVEYESPPRQAAVPTPEGHAPPPIQVLLFVGWLASRLGWRPDGSPPAGEALAIFRQADHEVLVTAHHIKRAAPRDPRDESWLRRVDIEADGGTVTVRRLESGALESTVEGTSLSPRSHVAPARPLDVGSVLSSELSILSRNPVYEQSLQLAERLFSASLRA